MAKTGELQLIVHPGSNYEKYDILNAFTAKWIARTNAEVLCRQGIGLNNQNRRDRDTLLEVFLSTIYEYRFERVNPKEVKRIKLSDMSEDIFDSIKDKDNQRMDVISYIRRRTRKNPNHLMFGRAGREVWYGGNENYTDADLDAIWTEIEGRTPNRRNNFKNHPMGSGDSMSFLSITVDDMDDGTARSLVSSEWDESDPKNPIMVKKRLYKVEFDIDLPMSAITKGKVFDNNIPVDIRGQDKINIRKNIIKAKN